MANQRDAQLDGLPSWAKIGATLTAISIVSGLCVFLVINLASTQRSGTDVFERLIDKFDKVIERHDDRQREWMRSHGDRIREENEKTRAVIVKTVQAMTEMAIQQDRSHMDIAKALESQTTILKKILDEKRMP